MAAKPNHERRGRDLIQDLDALIERLEGLVVALGGEVPPWEPPVEVGAGGREREHAGGPAANVSTPASRRRCRRSSS